MADHVPAGTDPGPEWFQEVADHSGLVFFIFQIRPTLALIFVNGEIPANLAASRPGRDSENDARALLDHIAPDSGPMVEQVLAMQPGQSMPLELQWRHIRGRAVHSRGWVRCRGCDDGSVVIEGALQDITELHRIGTELRNSEERHRLLAENAWDVVWTMGLDGAITYVSPAVERIRGLTPQEAMTQSLDEIHPPESATRVGAYFDELFTAIAEGAAPPTFRGEQEYYRKDGSIMTGELQVIPHLDDDGQVVEILGVTRDISERKLFESELTRLAVTDPLTELWNRRRTAELLAADLQQAQRSGQSLSVLMLDIDRFKELNDTHGHQTGDRVLTEVATRLREGLRATDVVGRWGGEEFMVLLRHCGLADAMAAGEKLRRRVADIPFERLSSVSVSIGAAELHADDDLNSWLARADAALYEAKRSGRNTVVGL